MLTLRKKVLFQTEVAITILALVLVMVIMNFAANWSLARVTNVMRETHRERLTISALNIGAEIAIDKTGSSSENSDKGAVKKKAARIISKELALKLQDAIANENIEYAVALDSNQNEIALAYEQLPQAIRNHIREIILCDSENGSFENNKYQYTYRHESESQWEVFHAPLLYQGQWLTLALAKRTTKLASIEKNMRYLLISGLIIILLLSIGVFAFFRGVTSPIRRITQSVAEVGTNAIDAETAVDELVEKYKQTITKLRYKEIRLLELNQRLEGQLSDVERFNQTLLGAITTGVVVIDHQGRLIGINEKARMYLGKPEYHSDLSSASEDYVGIFAEHPEIKSRVESALLNADISAPDFEYERTGIDGAINTFRVSVMPLLDTKNSLQELMLLISDKTEVARAQKRLEDSRQLATLGEMSAGLAHQLRNSISAAMGFSALVKRNNEKANMQASTKSLESLLKELHDEATLVDRFLSFSKPLALAAEPMLLSDFLREALVGYRSDPQISARVQIAVKADGQVDLDSLLLKQALGNLIDNALRASEENKSLEKNKPSEKHSSPVDITADLTENEVIIIVSDYGCGISLEEQEKIFTPFYSSSPSGTGLGLSLARKIVGLHGGALDLVSRPECGATFTIQFPRYQKAIQQEKLDFA